MKNSKLGVIIIFLMTLVLVLFLSFTVNNIYGTHSEKVEVPANLVITDNLTFNQIISDNKLNPESVKKAAVIKNESDLTKTLVEKGITAVDFKKSLLKQLNYEQEEASKNPVLIISKFLLWFLFMGFAFYLLRKKKFNLKLQKLMFLSSFVIFGVILGSEPNSMSTVTDMITAFAIKGVFFPPRFIALLVFLLVVILANKFICGWACQIGTLQDFLFRINRNSDNKKGLFRQYKIPFIITNTIRILFFIIFVSVAFILGFDIVSEINPFNIYSPALLSIPGGIFIFIILFAALFVYRPWCHLFCPFGLIGWMAEKISIFKIKVNYETCTACGECMKACPANPMEAILKQDRIKPDCFSCSSCISACPTGSITFSSGKRSFPPVGKFRK